MLPTIEETVERISKVATKKPLSGNDIADKLNSKYKVATPYSGRGIGRAIGQAIKENKILRDGPRSKPVYRKP